MNRNIIQNSLKDLKKKIKYQQYWYIIRDSESANTQKDGN